MLCRAEIITWFGYTSVSQSWGRGEPETPMGQLPFWRRRKSFAPPHQLRLLLKKVSFLYQTILGIVQPGIYLIRTDLIAFEGSYYIRDVEPNIL